MIDTLLTYEKFSTFLLQIETILNSHVPLCPLSDDPSDIEALALAQFFDRLLALHNPGAVIDGRGKIAPCDYPAGNFFSRSRRSILAPLVTGIFTEAPGHLQMAASVQTNFYWISGVIN